MASKADLIANSVLAEFDKLPPKRKPSHRGNGHQEWVPLSGIVVEHGDHVRCVALATGMKCLPASKIPHANGIVLHDWHAEILAIRTFNRFLLEECASLIRGDDSHIVDFNTGAEQPFKIKDGIKFHMYCSEAPCGDASMELSMSSQTDATPWTDPGPGPIPLLPGRADFSQLGIVRRKPSRRDAPATLSKSCSDKLALKQCTSLISGLVSLLVSPRGAYIDTLTVPESQHTESGFRRAFSKDGRMKNLQNNIWSDDYAFRPFQIGTTSVEFAYSKRSVTHTAEKISPSPLATAWSASGIAENIVNGVIQGRKVGDPKGASRMCRQQMWLLAQSLADQCNNRPSLTAALHGATYTHVKADALLQSRGQVIAITQLVALKGWIKNSGDTGFQLGQAQRME
ncbi:adenosine deaminase/editase, partial [Emericellopsis atlantica]